MKRHWILALSLLLGLSLPCYRILGQGTADRFHEAVHLEEVKGDLEAAISLYQKVVSEAKDRSIAAKAQLHIGLCYEKLGKAEAQKAYERVVRDYADQNQVAAEARGRLTALRRSSGVGQQGSGIIFRQVKFDGAEATPYARLSPDGTKMLYADLKNRREDQCNLRIVDLSSGQQQPLIEDYKQPWNSFRWGPDGSKVVYADRKRRQIRIISSKGGESHLVWASSDPEAVVRPLDWSRDGNRILISVEKESEWTTRLAVLPAAGGEPNFLMSGNYCGLNEEEGAFSPDGRYIVGLRWEGGESSHICICAVDTGKETRLAEEAAVFSPAFWSPDGKYLVFISGRMKSWDLWAVPTSEGRATGVPFRVKQGLGKNTALSGYTPAGQLTMFITGEGTPSDLFTLPVDPSTGEARGEFAPLAKYPTDHFNPRWSPDGKRVVYGSRKGQQRWPGIYIHTPGGKEEQEISSEDYFVDSVDWSPDSGHLLFAGLRLNGTGGIFRISLGDNKIMPLYGGGRVGFWEKNFYNLQWLPRANKFIFLKGLDEGTDVYTMDGDGKQVQLIAGKVPTDYWIWPAPDGSQIAYRQGQDLKLLTLADKSTITLARVPQDASFNGPAWSPDAKKIAFTDRQQLKVLPAGEKDPKVLIKAPDGCEIGGINWWSGIAWSPDGNSIAYLLRKTSKATDVKSELWVVPATGGTPRKIAVAPSSHPLLSDIIWHPGGGMIIATGEDPEQQQRGCEHWVMENFLPATQGKSAAGAK